MTDRASLRRLWLVAGAAVTIAIAAWIWIAARRATGADHAAKPATAPLDAHVLLGTPTDVAHGVQLRVPPGYTVARVDDQDIRATDATGELTIVVGVRTDAQLDTLTEPKQAALDYGTQNHLDLTALAMRGPDRMIAHYQATAAGVELHHSLFMFTGHGFRVTALLIVSGVRASSPEIAQLIDELADGRVVLP